MQVVIQASFNPMEFLFLDDAGLLLSSFEWDHLEDWTTVFQAHASRGESLKGIFLLRGPGAFTGLRKAVIVANLLAYEYKIPLYAKTLFEWMKALGPNLAQDPVYVYAGGQNWHREELTIQEEATKNIESLKESVYAFGPEAMRQSLAQKKTIHDFGPLSKFWKPEWLAAFGEPLDTVAEPFYLKAPHITG